MEVGGQLVASFFCHVGPELMPLVLVTSTFINPQAISPRRFSILSVSHLFHWSGTFGHSSGWLTRELWGSTGLHFESHHL